MTPPKKPESPFQEIAKRQLNEAFVCINEFIRSKAYDYKETFPEYQYLPKESGVTVDPESKENGLVLRWTFKTKEARNQAGALFGYFFKHKPETNVVFPKEWLRQEEQDTTPVYKLWIGVNDAHEFSHVIRQHDLAEKSGAVPALNKMLDIRGIPATFKLALPNYKEVFAYCEYPSEAEALKWRDKLNELQIGVRYEALKESDKKDAPVTGHMLRIEVPELMKFADKSMVDIINRKAPTSGRLLEFKSKTGSDGDISR